jgi:hypothetical protein
MAFLRRKLFLGHSPQKLSLQKGIASKSTDKRRTTNIDKYTEKSGYGIKISRSTLTKKSYLQLDAFVFKGKVQRDVEFIFSLESAIKLFFFRIL